MAPGRPAFASSHVRHDACPDVGFASLPAPAAAHLDGFSYPFTPLPDQSPPLALDNTYSQLRHHHGAAAAFPPTSDRHRSSPGTSDDGAHDRRSPATISHDDSAADDFGLAAHARPDGSDLGPKARHDKTPATPAWTELKTKAGKDRKRLPLACIACRRKKIRCSGEKPACKHCLRSRIPCVYKVTTRKAVPRTDYMTMLDKRLKRMEERIIKIVPKHGSRASTPIVRAVVKPSLPGPVPPTRPKKRGPDEAFGAQLDAWAKAPSRPRFTGPAADEYPTPQVQEEQEDGLFREGLDALPPKDVQEHLAEVFFDNLYGQSYLLLHKPSYMRKLRSDSLPPVLVLSVCAVAARFTPNPNISRAPRQFLRGEEWASHARDICTRRYEWPNITILTCLLMLGLHEFGTCHGGRSWALGGQAIRMAFALQLHKDLEHDPLCRGAKTPLSFIDREIRRRIMWACFLMDRLISSGSDRPMFIKEESLKIPLPVAERYFELDMPVHTEYLDGTPPRSEALQGDARMLQPEDSMGAAAFTLRSVAVWGRIAAYLHHGGKEADPQPWAPDSDYAKLVDDMDKLLGVLPAAFRYSPENLALQVTEKAANQFLLLHLSMQQNALVLSQVGVSLANARAGLAAPKDFVSRVGARTFAAANRISDILRDAEQFQCCVSAPFAGYCAFTSTTVHIMSIVSGDPAVKATAVANSGVNIRYLRKTMRYWGMFHSLLDKIRTQYRHAAKASGSGMPAGDDSAASSVLPCADWAAKCPSDGDFLDPALQKMKERGGDAVLEQKPELQSVEEFFTTLSPPKKTAESTTRPAAKGGEPETEAAIQAVGARPRTGRQQPPPPQMFSTSLAGHPAASSPVGIPQARPQSCLSLSPHLTQPQPPPPPPPSQHPLFPADGLTMSVPRQPQPPQLAMDFPQPLKREFSFDVFPANSPEGGGMAYGRIHPAKQNPLAPGDMASFGGQDAPGWFAPLAMNGPGPGLDVFGTGNVDCYANMFGMTPNPLGVLQHNL